MYGQDDGKEIMPGIRQVELGEWPVNLSTYKRAVANDFVVAPGAAFPIETMMNDMICHIVEGEFWVKQGETEFMAKAGLAARPWSMPFSTAIFLHAASRNPA